MAPGALVPEARVMKERGGGREGATTTTTSTAGMIPATVSELLHLDDAKAKEVWQGYENARLIEEVRKYEAALQAVATDLLQKGVKFDSNLIDLKEFRTGEAAEEEEVLGNVEDLDPSEWQVPEQCIPIHTNVTLFDWKKLYNVEQFDVIMMDPPWQLATHNPTRGVALGYSQLTDSHITNIPVSKLQKDGGFLFVWVINAKYKFCLDLFKEWGYEMVDEVVWAKLTVNRRLAKSHGFYLQHAKEVCLVARKKNKGNPEGTRESVASDIIFSERRGQSQKPEEIYEIIEELVPNGRYLEIFGRKNNLRDYWVTVGNEVTGTGMPPEDVEAIKESGRISNAVYGAAGSNTIK